MRFGAQTEPGQGSGTWQFSPVLNLFVRCSFAGLQLFELKFSIVYLYLSPNMWGNFPYNCLDCYESEAGKLWHTVATLVGRVWSHCLLCKALKAKATVYGWSQTRVEDRNSWYLETATLHRIFLPCFLSCCVSLLDLSMLEFLLGCCPTAISLQTNLSVQSCLHLIKLWSAAHHTGSTDTS